MCTSAQLLIHLHIQQVCTEHLLLLFDSFATPWTIACQTCLSMEFPRHLLSYSSRVALCWHFRLTLFQDESPLCSQTALSQAGGHCRICVGGDRPRWQWTVNSDIFNMDTQFRAGFPGGSVRKESACNARQGLGRSPGEGNGNLLQHSCLKNPMDRRAWWAPVQGVANVRHN